MSRSNTAKKNTSAPQAEVQADVSIPAAAPAAVEIAPPVETETAIVPAMDGSPIEGAGVEGDEAAQLDAQPAELDEPVVTHSIAAVIDKGFCRAGVRWYREPTYVNRDDWTDEQWQALTSEPMLTVKELTE